MTRVGVTLRRPRWYDRDYCLALRNSPDALIAGRGSPSSPGWWPAVRRFLVMILADGREAGYVIVTPSGEVSIIVALKWRGQGIGRAALRQVPRPAHAYIRPDNVRSLRAFRGAGFDDDGHRDPGLLRLVAR